MSTAAWERILDGRPCVVVSPQFWSDIWVSKHWVAHELSRCTRVLFIEPKIWVGDVLRHPWGNAPHIQRIFRPVRQVDTNLFVCSPRLLPRALGGYPGVTSHQVRQAVEQLDMDGSIVLNFTTNFAFARQIKAAVKVYYCVDPVPHVEYEAEHTVCEESDLLYAVSESYVPHFREIAPHKRVHVMPHGFDFAGARAVDADQSVRCPPELKNLPRPIAGFVGSIHDAYVDVARLELLSKSKPDWSFVLIGPYRNNPLGNDLSTDAMRRIRALRNVHLLGPKPFSSLPRYVKHFDVCLVLLNIDDYAESGGTTRRTLFKWLLYLALGKPVVGPEIKDALPIRHLAYLARGTDEYLELLDRAIAEPQASRSARIAYAEQYSFDKVLDRLAQPIEQFLHDQGKSRMPNISAESIG